MAGSLFLAQHRANDDGSDVHVIGRFHSLEDARAALDACYNESAWQGIRDETSGQRWWRGDGERDWIPTTSTSDVRSSA